MSSIINVNHQNDVTSIMKDHSSRYTKELQEVTSELEAALNADVTKEVLDTLLTKESRARQKTTERYYQAKKAQVCKELHKIRSEARIKAEAFETAKTDKILADMEEQFNCEQALSTAAFNENQERLDAQFNENQARLKSEREFVFNEEQTRLDAKFNENQARLNSEHKFSMSRLTSIR